MDIRKIIETQQIEHVYQPLWNLNEWSVFGYEALLRITSSMPENIEGIFIMAREQGMLYELDTFSIEGAVKNFPIYLLEKELLFINIFPSTLIHEDFEYFVETLTLKFPDIQGKIVFELNETIKEEQLWNIPMLKERIKMLRKYRFLVALDDVGKGVGTLQKMIEFEPDFIKLDRYFSVDLSTSKEKQKIISLMNEYCQNGIGLVLEGIEKDKDLAIAKFLNVPIVQGYLLGRPEKINTGNIIGNFRKSLKQVLYKV
jgi:EAL domain-containing protein (putative c-di-GMP-specific phosphodiesterase class I)